MSPASARALKTWGLGLPDADPMHEMGFASFLLNVRGFVQSILFMVSINETMIGRLEKVPDSGDHSVGIE